MVDYISNTEVDRNFEGITMLTPQCLSAQALKIHITVCTTIRRESRDFTNDRFQRWKPLVHTSFRKFTKCLQMIRCLEPDRLCGCNNVLSSQPILGIFIPKPGPIITVDSFCVKSELRTKMTVLRWFTGWWPSLSFSVDCGLRSGWIRLQCIAFWMSVFRGVCMVYARKVTPRNSPKDLIWTLTKTTVNPTIISHISCIS